MAAPHLFGATERSAADLGAIAAPTGLTVGEVTPIGLGLSLLVLEPS